MLAIGLPFMLSTILSVAVMDIFVPLTGRSGGLVPPDVIIGGVTAVLVTLLSTYTVSSAAVANIESSLILMSHS